MHDRRAIFRTAWANAKGVAALFGGSIRALFASCLKAAWAAAKAKAAIGPVKTSQRVENLGLSTALLAAARRGRLVHRRTTYAFF